MSGSTYLSSNHQHHPLDTLKTSDSSGLKSHELSPSDELASPIQNPDSASSDPLTSPDSPRDGAIPSSHLGNAHPTGQPSPSPTETHTRPFSASSSTTTTKPRTQPLNGHVPPLSASKAVGLQAEHVYRSQLSAWRFQIRSVLLAALDREMAVLERVQRCYRSGPLDRLMIHSSWLGSHQFFIVALPLIFWLGDHRFGRSQVYILAMSVYFTGILKDLFCIPRPYSPPIERLSISNHAAEYGFPSSHSATSASTFLMGFQYALSVPSPLHQLGLILGLLLYGFLLVFGRVYCGMHSIQDVVCGWMIGVFAWTLYQLFGEVVERWVTSADGSVAVVLIITGLVLTAAHPQPVEDCPCFEDSTAFVAVFVGVMIGHRIAKDLLQRQLEESWMIGLRFPQGLMKVFLGLMVIFGWRFLMKEVLSRLLPPLFRFFSPLLELPRKHYAPTRDYGRYRDELRERGRWTGLRARLIPSVVDLPNISPSLRNRFSPDSPAECQATQTLHPALHNRTPNALDHDPLLIQSQKLPSSSDSKQPPHLVWKHYDVDVLMRLIVYCGIGMLSSGILPILFDRIGLNG